MTNIGYGDIGQPRFETETFTSVELFSGHSAEIVTREAIDPAAVAAADLPAFSVVGRGASGLTLASGTVKAIGVTTAPIPMGTVVGTKVAIFRDGMFNPNALNWGPYFDTDLKKERAFEDADGRSFAFVSKPIY